MKKSEIVNEIYKRTGISKLECEKVIDTLKEVIIDALSNGDSVVLKGFVRFYISSRKERNGYNPTTGKKENFEAIKVVKCKVGQPLKDAVKEL